MTKPDFAARRAMGQAYFERWKAITKDGRRPAVINRKAHPEQWSAWLAYFRAHGLDTQRDLMLDGRVDMTVPCIDPADFDAQVFIETSSQRPGPDRRFKDE